MRWLKQGVIFVPGRDSDWIMSYAQVPVADRLSEKALRIYFSTRDADGRSLPTCIDIDADNPRNVLRVNTEPILSLGKPGTFDDCGIMPFCVVERGDEKRLYYVGWSLRRTVPYHQAIGLAVSADVSESGWDSEMIAYCHMYEHGGRKHLLYNGNGFGASGFGHAVLA